MKETPQEQGRLGIGWPETPQEQVDRLARFILREVEDEPSENEGAVDTAIRIIREHYPDIAPATPSRRP